MTTTYSDSLRLALQGFNDNASTWGTVINNQLVAVDKAVAGVTTLDVTGSVTINMTTSATDGSDSLSKRAVLKFTGLPTAHCSVTVPAVTKVYVVHSSLTANKNIMIHATGSSVEVTVGQSDSAIIYCDGTDMIKIASNFDSTLALLKSGNLSSIANTSAALVNLGITASAAELNVLDGITASVTELNVLDGITASVAELNYLDGVTSNVQTQLNSVSAQVASVVALLSANVTSVIANNPQVKAHGYITFSGTTPTVVRSNNVASVSYGGSQGVYTVSYTTTLATGTPTIVLTGGGNQSGTANFTLLNITARSSTSFTFATNLAYGANHCDPGFIDLVVY